MNSDLFRPQAVAHASRRLEGEVILASRPSTRVLAWGCVAVVVAVAVFCVTATYTRRETVTGWLVPQAGLIRVTARQAGMVEALDVTEGQVVRQGQALAVLRTSMDVPEGDAGRAMVRDVAAESDALEAQDRATQARLSVQAARLASQRLALERELAETRARLSALEERTRLANVNVERFERVAAEGYLSRRDLDAARSTALMMAQDAAEVRTLVLTYERQIGDLDAQLRTVPLDARAATAQSKAAIAEVRQKGTAAALQSTYVATAPIAGRVGAIPVDVGQTLPSGATIAVVSSGDGMEAELFAPSRAAGFIRPGQEVRLMYQAFPHQKFGAARGRVRTVSRTVLAPGELSIPGLALQEPVFRVRVKLDRQSVRAYGQDMPLRPGMLANADVVLSRRSLVEWLLDPIYAAGRR
ncbi:HlyD family secretion protein [Caulobacter sp. UNC358MFTsu5.1]|uniref:HlyD family secretion protein n=1 Tax=Caulobacter sp. UNC358MFTsu5.1 TaxID=1449049 RepID=UPI0004A6BEA9|nr:HlyD family efflux transporter periplasmic adaptor subunit [Caulobacter sp. UNC358MFTsu5.1]